MGWRGPGFGLQHLGRGLSGSLSANRSTETGYSLAALVDDSSATVWVSTSPAGTFEIDLDRGATAGATTADALVVPRGHNLDGDVTLTVYDSDDAAFPATAATRTLGSGAATAANGFVLSLTAIERRYVRLKLVETVFAISHYVLPQMIYTEILRPSTVTPAAGWEENDRQNTQASPLEAGGTAQCNHSCRYIAWGFEYPYVHDATDRAMLDAVVEASPALPLVLEPAYDSDAPLMATPTRRQRELFFPGMGGVAGAAAAYDFEFLEYLA